jgi:lipopolysaccharide transport system ATP-binding protein
MQPTIIFDRVCKKFSRGYVSDSLRDVIVAPFRNLFSTNRQFDLAKKKNEFWALKDVSFEVKPGEALGIIGVNGSGKSTTLKLLSRILRPDKGKIEVKGRIGALIELGAGFHGDLTGKENVFLNASILGLTNYKIREKYDEIVDFAELHEFMDTPVKWYSSGMFARLGFSIAVHTSPEVLLVDEVLSVGDVGFQRKCFDKMKDFKNQGITIVFVSHNLNSIASLCDRVILLSKGVINCTGNADYVIDYYLNEVNKRLRNIENSSVTFKEGNLFGKNNLSKTTFKSGESVRVEVKLLFSKDFPNIYISTYIRSRLGTMVFSTNSMRLSGESLSVKKGDDIVFSLRFKINLAPGVYELGTTVFDRTVNRWICNYSFATLIVEDNPLFDGIAYLEPELLGLEIHCSENR